MSLLSGRIICSETQPEVRYHLQRLVGTGGMGSAYLARRECPEGASTVVVKVVDPSFGGGAVAPELVARKEAVALGRLNESVPPTPFVVRLVDAGSTRFHGDQLTPWTAIEYVHGGVEGTTLEERVTYSLHKTGFAFDPVRAAHAIRCLASGLSAIHAVSVIHRDLSPGNVLCCGFGETEIFKISDFGVARTSGLDGTFVGVTLGTLGYSAPESGSDSAGAYSDVFSLAGVVYYLLTGQQYLDADSPMDFLRRLRLASRPSISDHATLSPEFLERPDTCQAIDALLAQATAGLPNKRPQTAEQFAASALASLSGQSPHSSRRLRSAVLGSSPLPDAPYSWVVQSRPRDDIVVSSAAWDADGHALALSPSGARFWDGLAWVDASRVLAKLPSGMTFTHRYEAGGWLVGGNSATLSIIDAHGISDTLEAPSGDTCFWLASGRFDDLLTVVGRRPGQAIALYTVAARRWFRPLPLPGVAHVVTLQRLDEVRWLLGGRLNSGGGFAAIYSPLSWEVTPLPTPPLRAFIAGASAAERSVALLCGTEGVVLRVDGDAHGTSLVPHEPDLSAMAIDVLGCEWAASRGALWSRSGDESWRCMWQDASWSAPFVSLVADAGRVVGLSADGGIIEGRSEALDAAR